MPLQSLTQFILLSVILLLITILKAQVSYPAFPSLGRLAPVAGAISIRIIFSYWITVHIRIRTLPWLFFSLRVNRPPSHQSCIAFSVKCCEMIPFSTYLIVLFRPSLAQVLVTKPVHLPDLCFILILNHFHSLKLYSVTSLLTFFANPRKTCASWGVF
jgi:hypothetical protein